MKNNTMIIMIIYISLSFSKIIIAGAARPAPKPASTTSIKPTTTQTYAIKARDAIAQTTKISNLGIIDSLAGTKGMSTSTPNKAITSSQLTSKPTPQPNPIYLNQLKKLEAQGNNPWITSESSTPSKVAPEASGITIRNKPVESNLWGEIISTGETSTVTTATSPTTNSIILQKTKDGINTLIGKTTTAYNQYQQNQANAKIAADKAAQISKNTTRPQANNIKIDNQNYQKFLKEISYQDLFKNLTMPNNKLRSNGYDMSRQPIIIDMFNKALLDMKIPEPVLTSPRFINQKYQQIKTDFSNKIQAISENTKITLQEKQTQINQAFNNASQNLTTLVNQFKKEQPREILNTSDHDASLSSIKRRPQEKKSLDLSDMMQENPTLKAFEQTKQNEINASSQTAQQIYNTPQQPIQIKDNINLATVYSKPTQSKTLPKETGIQIHPLANS